MEKKQVAPTSPSASKPVPPKAPAKSDQTPALPKITDQQSLIGRTVTINLKNRIESTFDGATLVALNALGATTTGLARGRPYCDFIPMANIDFITCNLAAGAEQAKTE